LGALFISKTLEPTVVKLHVAGAAPSTSYGDTGQRRSFYLRRGH